MKWTLARVIKIPPGDDGLVRVVDVKTAKGTFTRAVTNSLPLPGDVGLSPNGGGMLSQQKRTKKTFHHQLPECLHVWEEAFSRSMTFFLIFY
ncbi:hypothetical protein TNIN_262271 [Trichonephila inaurata madagascariensis]|uniref:DUF5641 domain-containing protein n=1 Tax=Trichonephila inaurata madagascariensis TaxID=2747483 RepID=A0A8X6WT75_9ARAC|nr:hypothetical protein TNIN_262271 [Trichonephila inaurata madagascariensis]